MKKTEKFKYLRYWVGKNSVENLRIQRKEKNYLNKKMFAGLTW